MSTTIANKELRAGSTFKTHSPFEWALKLAAGGRKRTDVVGSAMLFLPHGRMFLLSKMLRVTKFSYSLVLDFGKTQACGTVTMGHDDVFFDVILRMRYEPI